MNLSTWMIYSVIETNSWGDSAVLFFLIMNSVLAPLSIAPYPFPQAVLHLKLIGMLIEKKICKEKDKILTSYKRNSTYYP